MKLKLPTIALLFMLLFSCNQGDQPKKGVEAASVEEEQHSEVTWELRDDSVFTGTIEAWPPKPGKALLKAKASMDDYGRKFGGTVDYRITENQVSKSPWIPMTLKGENENESLLFEAPVNLVKGKLYIQFRVRDAKDSINRELTDWSINVD